MLKNLSLKNFKGFQVLDDLEFKPITILCGTNSSGKSSILKSILLMRQSLESQTQESALLFNSKYTKLGSFDKVIYNHKMDEEIEISYTFSFEDIIEKAKNYKITVLIRDFLGIDNNGLKNNTATYTMAFKKKNDDIIISKFEIKSDNIELLLKHIEDNKYDLSCRNIYCYDKKNKNKGLSIKTNVELTESNSLIPRIKISSLKDKSGEKNYYNNNRFFDMTCHYSSLIFQFLFEQISYIGPLRKEPSRRYIYEDEISSIGSRGENAAFVYSKEKDSVVDSYFYNEDKNKFYKRKFKFGTALNKWLKMMNIIDFDNSKRDEIIRLKVKSTSGVTVDISDVGFGVSQILPILVEGLRMHKGQTLLLEQPEIHLHPRLQMQLTDFFIAMAKDNKNTIIETHSEHVINRLIRRSLEDDKIANLINIYFINEKSEIEKIKIDKTKGIANWPKNFFDQAADEQKEILKLTCKNIIGK